jgi:RNA polymerase primary sigma factor
MEELLHLEQLDQIDPEEDLEEALVKTPTGDSVRQFLNEIGKYPLLTLEEEIELGRRIKEGKRALTRLSEALDLPEDVVREAVAYKMDSPLYKERFTYPEHFLQATRVRAYRMGGEVWEDWHKAREGLIAQEEMVRHNLRLVVSIAKRYARGRPTSLTFLDYIAEGAIGLMVAAERYDWETGNKFSTYATWWIRHHINRGIQEKGRLVRLPVYLQEEIDQMLKTSKTLEAELGREPTTEEIAKKLGEGWDRAKVEHLLSLYVYPHSLDEPVGEEKESRTFGDLIPDDAPSPEKRALEKVFWEKINNLLSSLKEREKEVLQRHFGLAGEREETLREIGESWGVSRERARQVAAKAMDKLASLIREAGLGEPDF